MYYKPLDTMVAPISNIDVAITIHSYTCRTRKLPLFNTFTTPFFDKIATLIKLLDTIVIKVSYKQAIVAPIAIPEDTRKRPPHKPMPPIL